MSGIEARLTVTGEIEIQARLAQVPAVAILAAAEAMVRVDTELARYIIFGKLDGQVLRWRTGRLADSITPIPVVHTADTVTGGVEQQDARAPYGKWQEFGAVIPPRFGNPVLAWTSPAGNPVFARHARGFVLPARSFMRSAEAEYEEDGVYEIAIGEAIAAAIAAETTDV